MSIEDRAGALGALGSDLRRGLSLISTQIATTYVFGAGPGAFGWANCTVNDATGELSIQSDWGSWAYRWSPDPCSLGAPSLTVFIGRRGDDDVDYLARKLQREGRGGQRWSATETVSRLRQQLCERLTARLEPDERALNRMSYDEDDTGRRIWNELGELAHEVAGSADLFFAGLLHIEGFADYVTEEPWQFSATEQTPEDRALREIVLPSLIRACRAHAVTVAVEGP